ncbi:MAG: hydantoinase B/oxoprolinase family protein [Sumerlaeia bacterium]
MIEAVELELFTNRFRAIAEEMGEQLRRTAISTNIKERLDYSCALLDPAGELIANAPHIPVHLGAMSLCVRRVLAELEPHPGDVFVTNHPAFGGSHLPDITVITPVFDEAGGALLGIVANRAHHAELGGTRPGSMPPDATRLSEEGIAIAPFRLIEGGAPQWDKMEHLLRAGPWPSRAPEQNLADLRSAVAANKRGEAALRALCREFGTAEIHRRMEDLKALSERRVRAVLAERAGMRAGMRAEAVERLDDGSPIAVAIAFEADGSARFDFAGTGAVHPRNLNATPAIVSSAVVYVLRLMVREDLPLNEGFLHPVQLALPPGCLLNPGFTDPAGAPAVGGGNTEVSQRLVDALIRALGLGACGQGTMNNVLFGNARFGYYETIGGGAGAGGGFRGADGVQVHMTNTKITDPEVLEQRFPVRLRAFHLREGSGGAGRWRGGEGLVREYEFLEPVSISLITQHRGEAPYGADGGEPGAVGRQTVRRAGGREEPVEGCATLELGPGDRLRVETPGGGGWGKID